MTVIAPLQVCAAAGHRSTSTSAFQCITERGNVHKLSTSHFSHTRDIKLTSETTDSPPHQTAQRTARVSNSTFLLKPSRADVSFDSSWLPTSSTNAEYQTIQVQQCRCRSWAEDWSNLSVHQQEGTCLRCVRQTENQSHKKSELSTTTARVEK